METTTGDQIEDQIDYIYESFMYHQVFFSVSKPHRKMRGVKEKEEDLREQNKSNL